MNPTRFLVALLAMGCEPLATPDYPGEAMARLGGTIASERGTPLAELALLWINWRSAPGTVLGTRSPVELAFPAQFEVVLHLPPPESGLNVLPASGMAEPLLGIAWIAVLRAGAAPPGGEIITHSDVKGLSPGDVLGWAEDFVLAYVDRTAPSGSHAAAILGGEKAAGFHLMFARGQDGEDLEAIRGCKAGGGTSDTCSPTIAGLVEATGADPIQIRLTHDLGSLRVPVFRLPQAVEEAFGIGP